MTNSHANQTVTETRDPKTPRTRSARGAVVTGSGAIAAALLLSAVGVILMGLGQFYAVVLLLVGVLLGWWGQRRIRTKDPEIR